MPSVVVEVHEFRGLWFVTGRWARGGGAGVDRSGPLAELGSALLGWIEEARRAPQPWFISAAGPGSVRREEDLRWERFCSQVAGVTVGEYRPEKRLLILADEQGLRCADDRHSPPRWEPLAASSPGEIGAALTARLAAMAPRWPAAHTALVTRDREAVLVCRQHGAMTAGPIARLTGDADPALVGAEVLAALAESRPDPGVPLGEATIAFRAALGGAGWTMGAFDAAPHVHIIRTTVGELFAESGDSREVRVDGRGPEPIGVAVLTLLGNAGEFAAIPPELRPVTFGPKTGWIAVRGASAEAVTEVLGLREARPMSWDEGVEAGYQNGVFVCPPVSGWVLAMGADMLHGQADIAGISRRLGTQVQIFRTHRVSEHHEWALADGGTVLRSLSTDDSGHQQSGEPTALERSLSVARADAMISEDDVFAVAGGWSLDPTKFGEHRSDAATGTWGRLP